MPRYELRYLCSRDVREIVDVPDPDEAELLARRRLLFSEPGFAIAILCDGVELNRVTQRSKAPSSRYHPRDRAGDRPVPPLR
jgi:hypothetical protein